MPYLDPLQQKAAQHRSYLRHKERYTLQQKYTRAMWRKKTAEYKNVPCADCGIRYPSYVMDFDHKEQKDKNFTISQFNKIGSWENILKEIKKCDVVCANCHRIRTHKQHLKMIKKYGRLVKLADTTDSKPVAVRRESSSLSVAT